MMIHAKQLLGALTLVAGLGIGFTAAAVPTLDKPEVKPAVPAEPAQPGEPGEPAEPAKPAEPADPDKKPDKPEKPAE